MKPLLPPIVVNGTTISPERVAAEAQNHPAPKDKPGLAWKAAARALAIRELMLQEAQRRGLEPAPQEQAPGRVETEDEALVRQLLEQAVQPAPPSEAELRAIYERAPDRFRAPTLYAPAHILFAAPPEDAQARAQARERAEKVLEALLADPQRFAALAREHSACQSREAGGSLGQVTAADLVADFAQALKGMSEGTILERPVETRYGLHLIRLDAKAEGEVLPFEAVESGLAQAWEKAAWARESRAFIADLASRAEVSGVSLESG